MAWTWKRYGQVIVVHLLAMLLSFFATALLLAAVLVLLAVMLVMLIVVAGRISISLSPDGRPLEWREEGPCKKIAVGA